MNEAIYLGAGVVLGAAITYWLTKNRTDHTETFQGHLKSASEQLLLLAKERLGSEKQEIAQEMQHKKGVNGNHFRDRGRTCSKPNPEFG